MKTTPVARLQAGRTLSHRLDLLGRAHLVHRRREGAFISYPPNADMGTEVVRLFTACC